MLTLNRDTKLGNVQMTTNALICFVSQEKCLQSAGILRGAQLGEDNRTAIL